ncbi:hypothetical protein N665_1404s0008 [Sinapis alba]|nr:hypothetical protein N665_1404s0008 [Sinapis alba]
MAIDVCCSEAPGSGISPRNSFSYDLDSTDSEVRLDSTLLDPASEFDFCFGSSSPVQEVSPADELFSNGKILPVQIKKVTFRVQRSASLSSSSSSSSSSSFCSQRSPPGKKIMRLKELLLNPESDYEDKPKGLFLQFKRSISLNYDKSRNSKGLIRSLHFLSRSNSTGSALNPKPNLLPKETYNHPHKTHSLPKQTSLRRSSSLSGSSPYKKPLTRNSFGNGNGGVRVSPVLNFPPPGFILNVTDGFFSIGSLCNGGSKTNRKTRL